MPTDTFTSFIKRVDAFGTGLKDPQLKVVMTGIGIAAKGDAFTAAAADLGGDDAFSGWAKAPLTTRFEHVGPGVISFHPTKRGAGPWTVAQFGRHSAEGPGEVAPRLTGGKAPRARRGKARQWNGRTRGKGTAEKALAIINRETPKRLQDAIDKALRKSFD